MKTLFSHLGENKNFPQLASTYNIGLLQTKTYKVIMGKIAQLLKPFKISNVDWVVLGIIFDHSDGLRSLALAEIMGVEQPFITVLTAKLKKMGFLKIVVDTTDKRAKILHLTKEGRNFVSTTEKMLAQEMEKISAGIAIADAMAYFKVQQSIVDYSEKES